MKNRKWVWLLILIAFLNIRLFSAAKEQSIVFLEEELHYIEENPIIYVGGNPNLFPIEYYDKKQREYAGIIPDYLTRISQLSGIQFKYIEPGAADRRMYLAKNRQVEVISAVNTTELQRHEKILVKGETLLTIPGNGGQEEISFAYTPIADQRLKNIMERCFHALTEQEREEIYIKNSIKVMESNFYLTILPLILIVIVCILLFYLYNIKQNAKKSKNLFLKKQRMDEVTGFLKIQYMEEIYSKNITSRERSNYWIAYFDIGLNQMSEVYGVDETELLLKEAAKIIKKMKNSKDYFARLEGNYFILLVKEISETSAEDKLKRMQAKIVQLPLKLQKSYEMHLSVGIYQLQYMDANFMEAVRKAMLASKYAKDNRLNCVLYDGNIEKSVEEECELEIELMQGILNNEFVVFLQPYFSLKTGEIMGCEALVRWDNPERGLLKPYKFISILEKKNMIDKMDLLVFQNVCKLLKKRKDAKKELFTIACNFSDQSFNNQHFPDMLLEIMKENDVETRYITIEVTEALRKNRGKGADEMLARLSEAGFVLVVDNFGAGYSSFTDLAKYQIGIVELDRELIANIESEGVRIAVEGIIEVFHKMGMQTMCKGAETKKQLIKVAELGCDYAQGYYYFQPMESEQLEELFDGGKIKIEE